MRPTPDSTDRSTHHHLLALAGLLIWLAGMAAAAEGAAGPLIDFFTGKSATTGELVFGILGPFLLFFAVVYALLRESGMLGHARAEGVIALVVALFATRFSTPTLLTYFRDEGMMTDLVLSAGELQAIGISLAAALVVVGLGYAVFRLF